MPEQTYSKFSETDDGLTAWERKARDLQELHCWMERIDDLIVELQHVVDVVKGDPIKFNTIQKIRKLLDTS